MSLQKGFLRPKITLDVLNLSKRKLIFGGLWWTALTFSIYTFLYGVRELLRYTSYWYNYEDFLVLTPTENYFYNFVFACLAGIFAFSAISNHWLRRPLTLEILKRHHKSAVFHDKTSYSWYFTYWFSKLSILFGMQTCFMGVFLNFSLFPDYAIVLVLMVINLFFHEWLTLRRVFKDLILPWMVGVLLLIVGVAGIFSFINLIPYKRFNESVLVNTVSYNLSIELPKIKSSRTFERLSVVNNVYIGFSKAKPDTIPQVGVKGFDSSFTKISMNQIGEYVDFQKSVVDEFEKDQLVWRLNIDKYVKMKYVKILKDSLSMNDARRIQYASSEDHSNGLASSFGLIQFLPNHTHNYSQVTSDEDIEYTVLKFRIMRNEIWNYDSVVSPIKLRSIVLNFFKQHGKSGMVEYTVDDESNFQSYITLYDQLVLAVMELRDDWTFNNFKIHYYDLDYYEVDQRRIDELARAQYPMNFIEK